MLQEELNLLYRNNYTKFHDKLLAINQQYKTLFSFCFDIWIASNQDAYLEITIHYINKD